LEKLMSDPEHAWWSEPMTLIFGKTTIQTRPTDPIFPDVEPVGKQPSGSAKPGDEAGIASNSKEPVTLELGDPWHFYGEFRHAHKLTNLPVARIPEIAVKDGSTVGIPLVITRKAGAAREITVKVTAPNGWKVLNGEGKFLLPEVEMNYLRVELQSPQIPESEPKGRQPDSIVVSGTAGATSIGRAEVRILLRHSALPQ
jgi:hypothetical protein